MMNIVLYHARCIDGFTAAFLMKLFFKCTNQECDIRPVEYEKPLPVDIVDKHLYIIDFSFPPEELFEKGKLAKSVTMLDHHATTSEQYNLNGILVKLINSVKFEIQILKNYSGVGLVYNYLVKNYSNEYKLDFLFNPRIIQLLTHVQDHDLKKFELQNTKIYYELIQTIDRTFDSWEEVFLNESDELFNKRFDKAIHFLEVKDSIAHLYAAKHIVVKFDGYKIPIVNAPYPFADAVGEILNKDYPFALTFNICGDYVYCSLRSDKHNGEDVAKIAERFNGGGHSYSSAFRLSHSYFTKLITGKLHSYPGTIERSIDKCIGFLERVRNIFSMSK